MLNNSNAVLQPNHDSTCTVPQKLERLFNCSSEMVSEIRYILEYWYANTGKQWATDSYSVQTGSIILTWCLQLAVKCKRALKR